MSDSKHNAPVQREKKEMTASSGGLWWKEGVIVFSEVTGWIAVPLIAAMYAGRALDERYGSGSRYYLLMVGLAFLLTCAGIGRLGLKFVREAKKEVMKGKSLDNDSSKSNGEGTE